MTLSAPAIALLLFSAPARADVIHAAGLDGQAVEVKTAGRITAVIFISTQCPVSNDYNERMKALYADYSSRGVQFVFLNANATEPAAEVARHAKEHGFSFAVLKDVNNAEADRFGAEVTPHAFIIGKDSQVIYRGAIDDSRPAGNVTKHHLRNALDAALAGRPLPASQIKAFGCSIKRAKKPA